MDRPLLSLARLRKELSASWVIVVFGGAFLVSQTTLVVLVQRIGGAAFLELQCRAYRASDYLEIFQQWESEGVLSLYRAHLIVDGAHWIWYAVFFAALLARLLELNNVSGCYNFVLVLPLVSGLLDAYENRLQHLFLSDPDFVALIDPLPLFSTIASNLKWLLAAVYSLVAVVLVVAWCRRVSASRHATRAVDDA
ncbi:MAG: hypothetical protein ACC628_19515 [Pirellulaceae bacterium]